ncbi:hypothetical protein F5884DRAFT_685218 [Xylogone sp. PMI_703]|nr:hypothetical protein F5884DRAFT_685218 [Xylogone sp. PMI_703]
MSNLLDPFSQLPAEILLKLIKLVPDFSSLWSIINASSAVSVLFDESAVEIVDAVIAVTIMGRMQELIRAVAHARALSWPTNRISRPRNQVSMARNITSNVKAPSSLNKLIDSKSLRSLVSLAHEIHVLAHRCIDHYIQASLAMSPSSLDISAPHNENVQDNNNVKSRQYQPRSTGPPSWVEEQRVVKALWRIQLFFELNIARETQILNWPKDDLDNLASLSFPDFYTIEQFESQQILTVYEFIQDIKKEACSQNTYQLPTVIRKNGFNLVCDLQPSPTKSKEAHFHQGLEYLDFPPMSFLFQRAAAVNYLDSPLSGIPFDPYRKFGFALWDEKRMTDLGFSEPGGKVLLHLKRYYFTWRSILTEQERMLGT